MHCVICNEDTDTISIIALSMIPPTSTAYLVCEDIKACLKRAIDAATDVDLWRMQHYMLFLRKG